MNPYLQLLAASLVSIAASLSVLHVLSGPLTNILDRICPDEQAAAFWASYTKVMLVIAPLLLVLVVDMFARVGNPLDSLRLTLMAALGGLLLGLFSVGRHLGRFVESARGGDAS